jgi:ribosome-binding factor A
VSRRAERIGNAIRSVLSERIQRGLSDPRIETLTSITHVDVSADCSTARVYVSVMAAPSRQALCLEALQSAAGRLRAAVGERVRLRHVPHLLFCLDDSVQRAFRTVQAIDASMAELGQRLPWEEEAAGPTAAGTTEPDDSGARRPDERDDQMADEAGRDGRKDD